MKRKALKIKGLVEMERFARKFASEYVTNTRKDHATLVFLEGDLGSGKTTFVRSLAYVIGITSRVTSPTFVIEKRYMIRKKNIPFEKLIHIDAYRLKGENVDILHLENDRLDPKILICIEWPENFRSNLSADVRLKFTFLGPNVRKIDLLS